MDQDQLDRLFTAALEAAIARVETDGSFFPLLFELRSEGTIQAVAVLEKDSHDGEAALLERFAQILRPRAADGTILASAIALGRSGAIEVQIRAADYAADVAAAYRLESGGLLQRQRRLTLGAITARPARNAIFCS